MSSKKEGEILTEMQLDIPTGLGYIEAGRRNTRKPILPFFPSIVHPMFC
jgi:hypothetical protein